MHRALRVGLVAIALAGVGACGAGSSSTSNSDAVDWSMYSPEVKDRIDRLASQGDCPGLQAEFDTADANDDATRARTGKGNADLMEYIDGKLEDAGCYG